MKHLHRFVLGITVATALGLSGAASAHGGGGMGAGQNCLHEQGMMWQHDMAGKCEHITPAMIEKHFDQFRSELKITASQEAAWQAFVAKAKQQHEAGQAMGEKMMSGTPAASAPERMDKGIEMMKQRIANMEAMSAALKDLYAVLTPEQKAVADRHFAHMGQKLRARARPAAK